MNMIPLVAVGLCAGILSGMFGIGGGIIIVPILMLWLGYDQLQASGTSLVALLAPVGILGVYSYYQAGKIGVDNLRAGGLIAAGLFFGAFAGSKIAMALPETYLRKGFAVFLVYVAFKLFTK